MPEDSIKTPLESISLAPQLKIAVQSLSVALSTNPSALDSKEFECKVGALSHIVTEINIKGPQIKDTLDAHSTPCYLLDTQNLQAAIAQYQAAFNDPRIPYSHYYAVKLNHEPTILRTIFAAGFGADVSSARELELALAAGATKFLFSGPGKTAAELQKALDANVDLVINIDNFSELTRLDLLTQQQKKRCRVGVRVSFTSQNDWDKFGIPISSLTEFFAKVTTTSYLDFIGIQFHMSWNKNQTPYIEAIHELSQWLMTPEGKQICEKISFIDIGGGFRPYLSEGFFAEDTLVGAIISSANELTDTSSALPPYCILESVPIDQYAAAISNALVEQILPLGNFQIFTEPGRILVNNALLVAVRVVDIKSNDCVITDGGTNIVGFERFEFDYFPVINITHPSMTERSARVYGSLCMPQDYWGLRAYSGDFAEGDIIIIPYQGALTYSTMNDFIKGRAPVVIL